MEFTEEQLYSVFELGAKEQEPAAPAGGAADQNLEEGVKEQEPAAPAAETGSEEEQNTETDGDGAQAAREGAEGAQGTGTTQTMEERREHAARRRREEQQAAVHQAVEAALQAERQKHAEEMKAFFAAAGLKNSITGEAIDSMEAFEKWKKSFDEAKLQNDLKAGKLSREVLDQLVHQAVENNPVVKQAQEIVSRQTQLEEQQRMEAAKARMDAQIAEIHKMDPSINSLRDLLRAPNAKAFYEYVNRGNTYVDAYYLANRERLDAKMAEAARTQAMSNSRGKDHLSVSQSRGNGATAVPPEQLRVYKELMPEATLEEIQRFHNKQNR